jgi:hypothetical protein
MKTLITFVQMQILSLVIAGPIISSFLPFNALFWTIVCGAGLIAALAMESSVRQPRTRKMFQEPSYLTLRPIKPNTVPR